MRNTLAALLTVGLLVTTAEADTYFVGGDAGAATMDLRLSSAWTNGSPSSTNHGYIEKDGTIEAHFLKSFDGAGTVINHTAGDLDFGNHVFHFYDADNTYNMSGGSILTTFAFRVPGITFNLSGGSVTATGNDGHGPSDGGRLNLSGSGTAHIDAFRIPVAANGTVDFAPGWTGSFTVDAFSGNDWRNLFTGSDGDLDFGATYDDSVIDGTTFDEVFVVSNGGSTLAIPEPATVMFWGFAAIAAFSRKGRMTQ